MLIHPTGKNRIVIAAIASLLLLLGALFLIFRKPEQTDPKSNFPPRAQEPAAPQRRTLSGEFICVPPIDPAKPSPRPCVEGIKTEEGTFLFDKNLLETVGGLVDELKPGVRFSAAGVVTPIEYLSTDIWDNFGLKGVFSATDSVRLE